MKSLDSFVYKTIRTDFTDIRSSSLLKINLKTMQIILQQRRNLRVFNKNKKNLS